eukprot:TRINITY_DN45282_c0_g1_i1.p1 TRINITY_DN45282_c0_g1~~TRINITY_DN45282_c0_g1_i1.p1  ORF type:complete len:466 (-),score=70.18 TRINITY_DN45282_c0_g1_i1:186-1583(-)
MFAATYQRVRAPGRRWLLRREYAMSSWQRKCATATAATSTSELKEEGAAPPDPTRQQLVKYALVSAIPFIGFGFMDNFVMIIAGDVIDASIGVKLGVSTMAAAGLGNTLSDAVGIYTGDWIEEWCRRAGFKAPKLTTEQLESPVVRHTKMSAHLLGLTFGCLLGMCPLLFQGSKEEKEQQRALYDSVFRYKDLTIAQFSHLMSAAKFKSVPEGAVLIAEGQHTESVLLLVSGTAKATGGAKKKALLYRGTASLPEDEATDETDAEAVQSAGISESQSGVFRGSFIGASALVDQRKVAVKKPYPREVRTTSAVHYVEWNVPQVLKLMSEDPAIEKAVISFLHSELVEYKRRKELRQLKFQKHTASGATPASNATIEVSDTYRLLVQLTVAEGVVHHEQQRLCEEFRSKHDLSLHLHKATLGEFGWTEADYINGTKGVDLPVEQMKRRIPEMLEEAGIASRVVSCAL